MIINVDQRFESWIDKNVIPAFSRENIDVTPAAKNLLCHALQAQLDDKLVPTESDLFGRADKFAGAAIAAYRAQYGKQPMNFNRAMHLLINLNSIMGLFPWGSSV
jgi:hypothetical protein